MQFRRHFIISEACVNNPSLKITFYCHVRDHDAIWRGEYCFVLFYFVYFLLLFLLLLFQFIFRLHIVDLSVFKTQLHLLWIEFHFESWLNSTSASYVNTSSSEIIAYTSLLRECLQNLPFIFHQIFKGHDQLVNEYLLSISLPGRTWSHTIYRVTTTGREERERRPTSTFPCTSKR